MLKSLHIQNMAVIRELEIEFSEGLSVFTGETGAGKSVLTDRINFLVCNKIARDLLRSGEKKALVSAVFSGLSEKTVNALRELGFETYDSEITLERTLTSEGKSACRIDGRGVTQQLMRKVGSFLISIHGQHDSLRLSDENERFELIDTFARTEDKLVEYREKYYNWKKLKSDISAIRKSSLELLRMKDMLDFQIKEITAAKLKHGEEDELVREREKLRSAERIKKHTDSAARTLCANEKGITASSMALHAAEAIAKVSDVVPEFAELAARLRSCTYELDDISSELQRIVKESDLDSDPGKRLDEIESRLALITRLKRKYGSTVKEIIEFGEKAKNDLDTIENSDGRIEKLMLEETRIRSELIEIAKEISKSRSASSMTIEREVCEILHFLDMPKVRFSITISESEEFNDYGKDEVEFLIAANPGEPLLPLSKSASGGELSRVMLAIKCAVAGADSISTLIFDEVDSGISGKTSRKVGIKLKQAARSAQVLSVTHSAQIASLAHTHLWVSKTEVDGRAETTVVELDENGRIDETARILGGISVSESQRLAAIDMINEGKTY